MEEEVRICDYCGRVLAEGEGTPVDDELLCDDCVEEHCVTCDHCGETIWEQNSVSDEDTCLCQDCFNAHYYRCESCGQIVPESIVCWHGDLPYCERCFDEFEDEIEEYGYKPTPIFYGNGNDTSVWNWKWMKAAKIMTMLQLSKALPMCTRKTFTSSRMVLWKTVLRSSLIP